MLKRIALSLAATVAVGLSLVIPTGIASAAGVTTFSVAISGTPANVANGYNYSNVSFSVNYNFAGGEDSISLTVFDPVAVFNYNIQMYYDNNGTVYNEYSSQFPAIAGSFATNPGAINAHYYTAAGSYLCDDSGFGTTPNCYAPAGGSFAGYTGVFYELTIGNRVGDYCIGYNICATNGYSNMSPSSLSITSWWGVGAPGTVGAPCTLTLMSGSKAVTKADGVSSYDTTLAYTSATMIVAAPVDSTSATITKYGKIFPADSTVDSAPTGGSETISVTPAAGADPNATVFWCYGPVWGWYSFGSLYTNTSTYPSSTAGCTLDSISGLNSTGTILQAVNDFTLNFANTSQSDIAFVLSASPGTLTGLAAGSVPYFASTTDLSKSFTYTFLGAGVGAATSVDFPIDMTSATGLPSSVEMWCYSTSTSAWVDLGTVAHAIAAPPGTIASGPGSGGSSNGFWNCSSFPSLSLGFNIGSDLVRLANWSMCAVQYMVIPTSFTTFTQSLGIKTTAPFSWVSDFVGAGNVIVHDFTNDMGYSVCSAPGISPFSGYAGTSMVPFNDAFFQSLHFTLPVPSEAPASCTAPGVSWVNDSAGNLFGYRDFIYGIEEFTLILGFFAAMWIMLPWSTNRGASTIFHALGLRLNGNADPQSVTDEGDK